MYLFSIGKKASHNWRSVKSGGDYAKQNTYDYDYSGRLTSVSGDQNASYDFDALGRMVKKSEGSTSINFIYSPQFYRPAGMSINDDSPSALGVYIKYDAAGNIWYDLHNKLVYKNGKNNMPSKVFLFSTMPQNITLDDVDALDDVNGSSPYQNDVTERIDIAYDDGGDRLWYSYNKLADGSGMTRVTLPGVGVYEATKTNGVNGTFKLVRKDLVAGGYRDEAGNAHFPVMDAQGNVRGYATSDGMQSAYDYYAYGTIMDLSPDAGDDNKRWQDKEFDGEHGKYYFGARYFDPFFGMWMSPDPAGQFANPYTYGGDPVNFVDPNGEFAFAPILIGAAIGAIVGGTTAYANCSGKDGCVGEALKMALVGGTAGAAGGAVGEAFSGLSAAAAGAKGLSVAASSGAAVGSAGTSAAFVGGAVNGAISGFASSAVTYSLTTDSWNLGHFAFASLSGTFWGGLIGGLTDMFRYELSTEFQWETYEKIYARGKSTNREDLVARYIANLEGIDPDRVALTEEKYIIKKTPYGGDARGEGVREDGGITIAKSGRNSAGNFYETVAHEAYHEKFAARGQDFMDKMFGKGKLYDLDSEEALVRDRLLSHRFSNYWGEELRKKQIKDINIFLRRADPKMPINARRTLQNYGWNYGILY
ncbi:MAG: RHS repeat-associated core domain-containing protein [Fibrobacter sp.]|nr:RHS repeat-associated core domain-containing protein [Fibrobacter sp.]